MRPRGQMPFSIQTARFHGGGMRLGYIGGSSLSSLGGKKRIMRIFLTKKARPPSKG